MPVWVKLANLRGVDERHFWLTDEQIERLRPFFPTIHGVWRVDDMRVLRGIIFINRNGLRWCDAPKEHGPPKTPCNRWKRWVDKGIFARMMDGLAAEAAVPKIVMMDATLRKAHRTATSLRSKRGATIKGAVGSVARQGIAQQLPERGANQARMNIKLHAVTDAEGRTFRLFMAAGQVSDDTGAATIPGSLTSADLLLAFFHGLKTNLRSATDRG